MRRNSLSLPFAAASYVLVLQAGPAHAQSFRTWVSGAGDDANICNRVSPCKTFAGAISKTALNGEINCLDSGAFGVVTITKSITIDCHDVFSSILYAGTNGINIPFNSFTTAGETRKTVRLRNLNLNGIDSGVVGIRITGGTVTGGSVLIEDCLIDGGTSNGISDERTGGGELYISNTTVRNVGQTGIVINPAGGTAAGQRIDVSVNNVRVHNSNFGLAAGSAVRVMISRSVFSGNSQAGIEAEGPLSSVEVNVNDSVTSNNLTGIQIGPGTVTIRLSNNDIAFNRTAFAGATQSFNNNRVQGNAALGTAPTPTPIGQQ